MKYEIYYIECVGFREYQTVTIQTVESLEEAQRLIEGTDYSYRLIYS